MKIKIKEAYLLILIVLGLVSLSVYSTYALFTKEVTIDNVVSFNTSISLSDSNLVEYELVTLNPNETKIIELVVSNSSISSLYYGCWYELLTTNNDVSVGVYTEKNNTSASGTLDTSATKTILLGIVNNSTSTTLVNIGVVGSTTENLGLSSSRTLVTDTYVPEILVTNEVLAANTTTTTTTETVTQKFTEAKSYVISLSKGTHNLEVWGASGGDEDGKSDGAAGGYSKGTLTLAEETTTYVYVGGEGTGNADTISGELAGGFNGGGNAYSSSSYPSTAGGGASDIRLGTDSLYARVIVAGGGGGRGSYNTNKNNRFSGGVGGGLSGGNGEQYSTSYKAGTAGSQTSAGISYRNSATISSNGVYGTIANFGTGASASTALMGGSGGGGGWYGGGFGSRASAGGGSGYVYTSSTASNYPSGCLLNSSYYLTNAETITGDQSFKDPDGSTVIGHAGDGVVKITGPKVTSIITYQIPRILGLTPLKIKAGSSKDLEVGVTYECETGITTCTYLGSDIIDTSSLELGTYVAKYKIRGLDNKIYVYERTINIVDEILPNEPVLVYSLIPVVYNDSVSRWVKADTTSLTSSYGWYDYDQKKWANAVLVSSANRSTYQGANAGTIIANDEILAFYVWIPRFKYKVWNINKVMATDSYNAQTTGIDMVFESDTDSTGTISCTYSYAASSSNAGSPNETCTGSNGDYYTHPAFTFGSQELKGFWMGKFELSSSSPQKGASYGGGESTTLTPRILPNVTSWRNNYLSNYWKVIYDMQTSNNIYGLSTSRTNVDSHMLTNMEWGAVTYLTHSKYGKCTNGSCTAVSLNGAWDNSDGGSRYYTYYTTKAGCGPISSGSTSQGTTCNAYNTTLGKAASTTGNIYGVYDMSGGADEYVMGNMTSANGTSYTYNARSAGTNFTYSTDTAKYLTPYAYGTTNNNQTAYNRGRLGDATGEIVLSTSKGWYSNNMIFPFSTTAWFTRGGAFNNGSSAGVFEYRNVDGGNSTSYSTRAALSIAN